jgi:hypothetical protein
VAWTLENWSDLAGFVSGAALVVTAWRNDGLYGFVDNLRAAVDEAKKAAKTDEMSAAVVTALEEELGHWSWVDRWSLRFGAGLLVLSYLLRMAHQWCGC